MEEKDLIERARKGDVNAFGELYEINKNKIFGAAMQLLGNPVDAEDVVSETFLNAYLNIRKFKGRSAFSTWLYRICFNVAYHWRRKRKLIFPESSGTLEDNDKIYQWVDNKSPTPEEKFESEERKRILRRCIAQLPKKHKEIILLREISGLSYEEIANELKCSRGTVMSRLHRAREKLRQLLEKAGITE